MTADVARTAAAAADRAVPRPTRHRVAVATAPGSIVASRHLAVTSPQLSTAAPDVDERTDTTTIHQPDRPWDVIVWDDPVNLMSYVVWVFMRVFQFTEPVARKLMLEVHEQGRSLVASEPRERAEMYLQQLHAHGLHATIQRSR